MVMSLSYTGLTRHGKSTRTPVPLGIPSGYSGITSNVGQPVFPGNAGKMCYHGNMKECILLNVLSTGGTNKN
jgi:hypothetical protein